MPCCAAQQITHQEVRFGFDQLRTFALRDAVRPLSSLALETAPPLAATTLAATTLAAAKGRLIRCTVPTATPNRAAILRTPSVRPGAFKAAWIRFSTSGATLAPLAGPAPHFVQHHSLRRSCSRARLRVSFSLLSKQANIPPNAPNHATPHASPAPRFLARA